MIKLLYKTLFLLIFVSGSSFAETSAETHRLNAEKLVSRAADTLPDFENESHEWDDRIAPNFKRAKAVLIVPRLYKAGLFIGGERGSGVLLVREEDGGWSYPTFYELYSASLGFQIGAEQSQILLLIMNDGALKALYKNKIDVGGEVNVAAGTAGGSAEVSTTSNFDVDIITYSLGAGAFAGLSFEGGYIEQNKKRNSHYYGSENLETADILSGSHQNQQAERLRAIVSQYGD